MFASVTSLLVKLFLIASDIDDYNTLMGITDSKSLGHGLDLELVCGSLAYVAYMFLSCTAYSFVKRKRTLIDHKEDKSEVFTEAIHRHVHFQECYLYLKLLLFGFSALSIAF